MKTGEGQRKRRKKGARYPAALSANAGCAALPALPAMTAVSVIVARVAVHQTGGFSRHSYELTLLKYILNSKLFVLMPSPHTRLGTLLL